MVNHGYYTCMRQLNIKLLKEYLVIQGKLAKETLAIKSKVSFDKIGKLLRNQKNVKATELEMDSLCKVTGYTKDELFPISTPEEKSA